MSSQSLTHEFEVKDFDHFIVCIKSSLSQLFSLSEENIFSLETGSFRAETRGEIIKVNYSFVKNHIYLLEIISFSKRFFGGKITNRKHVYTFLSTFEQCFGHALD